VHLGRIDPAQAHFRGDLQSGPQVHGGHKRIAVDDAQHLRRIGLSIRIALHGRGRGGMRQIRRVRRVLDVKPCAAARQIPMGFAETIRTDRPRQRA
jgi:hypothetical protein